MQQFAKLWAEMSWGFKSLILRHNNPLIRLTFMWVTLSLVNREELMKTNETHDAVVLEVKGLLKDDGILSLGKEIHRLDQDSDKDIVLDVSGVTEVNSR